MSATCQYCKREFAKETSLAIHMCEPRRRHRESSERGVQLGLQAYLKFYEITQGSARLKTFDDFAGSPYYRAFVKFGRHCVSIRAINPARFTEWVLKQNKKIDNWCSDNVYTEYLIAYLQTEAVADAILAANRVRKVKRRGNKEVKRGEEKGREGKKEVMRFFIAKVKFSLAEIQLNIRLFKYNVLLA